jgi:hypothetical protein
MKLSNSPEEARKAAYKFIKKHGYFTGSRCWKVHHKNSDYDYLLHPDQYKELKNIRGIHGVVDYPHDMHESAEGNPSMYLKYKGRLFNIISPKNNDEYLAWCWATECLKAIPFSSDLVDKPARVSLFKSIKDAYLRWIEVYIRLDDDLPDMGDDIPF